MKLFNATVLVAAVSAQTGNATLEATIANETHAEFYGQLKVCTRWWFDEVIWNWARVGILKKV